MKFGIVLFLALLEVKRVKMCLLRSFYGSGSFLNRALNVVTFSITCIYIKHRNNCFLWFEIYDLNFEIRIYTLKTLVLFNHLFLYA